MKHSKFSKKYNVDIQKEKLCLRVYAYESLLKDPVANIGQMVQCGAMFHFPISHFYHDENCESKIGRYASS